MGMICEPGMGAMYVVISKDLGLGDLIEKMRALGVEDSNVLKPVKEIPEESLWNYRRYRTLIFEINRREQHYKS